VEYAKERELLTANPLESFKWRAPKPTHAVDRRSVVNPFQARALLQALADERPKGARSDEWESSGPRLLYFAALRPEEAVSFRETDAVLPAAGWGEIHLSRSTPDVGRDWTDNGAARDVRQLKHRGRGDVRIVPCPPELTAILRATSTGTASRPTAGASEASVAVSCPGRRTTARGSGPGRSPSRPRSPHRRLRALRTHYGTPASPRGSTVACRPLR